MVWSEPAYKVAERYKTSGVALAKKCRQADVPLPPRGYWARLKHGKRVRRPALKPAGRGKSETIVITEGTGPRPGPEQQKERVLDPKIAKLIAAEQLEKNRIVVPEVVTRLHPEAKKLADAAQIAARGWDRRNEPSSSLERRRRRILHAFFRAVEARGGTVKALPYDRGFDVTLLGSEFAMSCSEPEKRVRVPLTREEMKARQSWETRDYKTVTERAGYLRMRTTRGVDRPMDFRDTEDRPLETQLNDVMVWLLECSITVEERDLRAAEARLRAEEEQQRRWEAEQRRWEAEERRRKEKERVDALIADSERWRKAETVRAFVRAASDALEIDDSWRSWALAAADAMDPIVQSARNET
jgi:hypothetical protein